MTSLPNIILLSKQILCLCFWETLVKRFALCYRTVVCPVLSVGPYLLWPNGWIHQDTTWHGGRPQPRRQCILWGPSSPSAKGAQPPIFGPCSFWPNGWMDKDASWRLCVRWGPSSQAQPSPNFRPLSSVAKRLDGSRYHLERR